MKVITSENLRVPEAQIIKATSREEIVELLLEALEKGTDAVIGLYIGAWRDYPLILKSLNRRGVNPFLYVPVDPREAGFLHVGLEELVRFKMAGLDESLLSKVPFRITGSKSINRRVLLTRPLKAMFSYYYTPLVVDAERCISRESCYQCIEECPRNALEDKPPKVSLDACTGCGICVGLCPEKALAMPWTSFSATVRELLHLREALGDAVSHIVFVCRSSLPFLEEILDSNSTPSHPVAFKIINCPGEINEETVLIALSQGFSPIIYCDTEAAEKCGDHSTPLVADALLDKIHIARSVKELREIIAEKPRARLTNVKPGFRGWTHRVLSLYGIREAVFKTPVIGFVEAGDTCTLCGVCATRCPRHALKLEKTREHARLLFNHESCTGCGVCTEVCPENVLELTYKYVRDNTGWVKLAESPMAKCSVCGKPIAPEAKIRMLEDRLRAKGVPENIIRMMRVCPDCKMKIEMGVIKLE